MNQSCSLIGIVAPFAAGIVLSAAGMAAAYFLRAKYSSDQIADERGGAGLLLVAIIGSFLFTLIAFAIGAYASFVCWLMPG